MRLLYKRKRTPFVGGLTRRLGAGLTSGRHIMHHGVLLASTLLLLVVPQAASASTPNELPDVRLKNDQQVPTWSGTITSDGARIPSVAECQAFACDHVKLNVDLPNGILKKDGGVEVALRLVNPTFDDNLGLVVYQNGTRIAVSNAAVATAQAVLLPFQNGTYDVYIVDGIAYGDTAPTPSTSYEALAQVRFNPKPEPSRNLLPDLVALPQQEVTFDNPGEIFNDPTPAGSNCHQSEIDEDGAHLCLRFDQVLGNIGEGPLDLRFDQPHGVTPVDGQAIPVVQRIYKSTGGYTDVPAGNVIWHAIHQHYHFVGFAQSKLWAEDASGNRTGANPVATGNKVSFCIADTNLNPSYWTKKSFAPQTYPAPNCLTPDSTTNGTDHFKQGMSAGWADEYEWFLPGQYIEVSGVNDGDYILDTTVDPTSRLVEVTKANNCGSVRVRLTDMHTSTPHAQLLGVGPACKQ
ncbi:MAG TPA: lysyl oxidase family protein [Candidatus Saccharimonadales bacterium]|nr:lysyl oxidase family protein [Candidatus Saccharimonadales bacterium]